MRHVHDFIRTSRKSILQIRKSKLSCVMRLTVIVVIAVFLITCMFDVDDRKTDDDVNVAAYYQMGLGNSIAASVVLYLFRSVYPSSPLYIHWDADHAPLMSGADLITYNKNEIDKSANNHGLYFASVTAMDAYIKRIKRAANLQKNGWVLLLEDDVWVLSRIQQKDLRYDISGICGSRFYTQCRECPTVIQMHSRHHRLFRNASCYGGCGGNYINSSRILRLEGYHDLLRDLLNAVGGPVASDMLLSSVILADGGTIGDNPGFYEPGDLPHGPPNILHQMKLFYFINYILH